MQTAYLFRSAFSAAFGAVAAIALSTPSSRLAADDKKDEGWIPLFNGKDLTGWKIPDPPSGQFKGVKEVKNDAGKVTAFVGIQKDEGARR